MSMRASCPAIDESRGGDMMLSLVARSTSRFRAPRGRGALPRRRRHRSEQAMCPRDLRLRSDQCRLSRRRRRRASARSSPSVAPERLLRASSPRAGRRATVPTCRHFGARRSGPRKPQRADRGRATHVALARNVHRALASRSLPAVTKARWRRFDATQKSVGQPRETTSPCQPKRSARSITPPAVRRIVTGGRTSCGWTSCTSIPRCRIRWAATSTTPKEFESLDFAALKKDLHALMTDSQDWWPADFGHYGPLVHSHGVAQRRHVSHRRRPRRRRPRQPALRAAQQLAGQRQPRQGAPPALADQAEVRPRRSRGPTSSSSRATSRSSRWAFKTFGFAGGREDIWEPGAGRLLGHREDVAGDDTALLRRARSREPARRRADGPHLRQSGRPERQPGSDRGGARHPRDVRAHGDERRGDRRADRRRPHLRQDARRRRSRRIVGPDPEAADIEEQGLGWKNRFGTGKGGDAITSGLEVTWTSTPTKWGNGFFENLFGYEWELTKSPAGAQQWTPEGRRRRRHDAGCARSVEASRAHHADDRPLAALRSGVREDLAALPREPGSARRRVRARVVQADPPRHGPARALPRPGGPREELLWQDPIPAVDHPLIDERDVAALKSQGPRVGTHRLAARVDGVGVGVDVPRLRQARRRERRAHPPRAAEGLGGQPAGAAREGARRRSSASRRSSTARRPAARRSRSPT